MPWAKFDDGAFEHPKVFALSDSATATWWRSILWSARNGTDGHVPDIALRTLIRPGKATRTVESELVNAGLWELNGDGYHIHDFHDYQPTAAEARAAREAARLRKRRQRGQDAA